MTIARIEVTRETLTEYPLAEKVRGGWQNGVTFYPDETVTKIMGEYAHTGTGTWEYGIRALGDDERELVDHLNGMMDSLDDSVSHDQVYEQLRIAWDMARALRRRGPVTDAFSEFVDHLGVDSNEDHAGEWWDGYRQAQRDNMRRASIALEAARAAS